MFFLIGGGGSRRLKGPGRPRKINVAANVSTTAEDDPSLRAPATEPKRYVSVLQRIPEAISQYIKAYG